MNKTAILVCVALLATPLAYAHVGSPGAYIRGPPKPYCETTPDWHVHDYGPPATGTAIGGLADGNLDDCDRDFNPNDPWCVAEEVAREDLNGDGQVCEKADYDGHMEWAWGGAYLLAEHGDEATFGSYVCYGEDGHHPYYGPFWVVDVVLGSGASFEVAADTVNLVGPDPVTGIDCGDFQSDAGSNCVGTCSVTFPPGRDGAYYVFVTGTAGHVCTIPPDSPPYGC